MNDFRFLRTEDQQENNMIAILSAFKFENWLKTRIKTLLNFSNNFYNNILDLMYEILSNMSTYEREIKELIKTKMFYSEAE